MVRVRGLTPKQAARLALRGGRGLQPERLKMFLCIGDHYEPMWGDPPAAVQRERVARWVSEYPRVFGDVADSRGRPPQHTFFYPAEVYTPEHLEELAVLCRQGFGDVEVHLHHDNDTAEHLRETLETFKENLANRHGLLRRTDAGELTYGFIHGNWAFCNSRPDGRWCGVNDELTILRETGCYADFTMPSAPSTTQTQTFNSIYYATDKPGQAKSHEVGIAAEVGRTPSSDSLLLIQGPLALDWRRRKVGLLPGLENGDLHGGFPPSLTRLRLWLQAGVSVVGRRDWVFVKLHTHGAPEKNANMLLGEPMRRFHESLAEFAGRHEGFEYYYVTAYEMALLVHQAERGRETPQFDAGAAPSIDAPFSQCATSQCATE